ncbi:hypothetical protein GPS50_06055 [Acinetobacter haemolyticus]|uniref:hypothetical protein n=1 Tax=Acinetobacter haemolyticus TaxID=29430 RepID=UPI000E574538|nr:hypothetical protein [Acinetobacter haemolyticus]NAR49381.1 hypothetical protein [Acinetobacter haemolyticus]NAR56476.1 hypothetical protein [Acinetobacter haemolyticus]NAR79307.1 hypothetical protein [Acinetobacter haemolyticus]NAR89074.1 hypothetical protein [Acinetobacter haemolyticus]NAR96813.1 hypothetical protein [Acinetobacter haemolyticus]
MKYLIPIFCICLFSITNNSFAQTNKKITVVVKEVNGFSESGDGYTFTSMKGKEYYVYNEGELLLVKESYILKREQQFVYG